MKFNKILSMENITLNKIHEDLLSLKKDMNRIRIFFDEDEFKLSDEIKRQIIESRKLPMSAMISQEEVEKEFL
jgi:hypothetical protein